MNLGTLQQQYAQLAVNPWLRALGILILAMVAALLLRLMLIPVLRRLSGRTASDLDDRLLKLLNPALFQTVFLLGLSWASRDLIGSGGWDRFVYGLGLTLVILVWGRFFMRAGVMVFQHLGSQGDQVSWIQPQTLPMVQFLFKVIVVAVVVYLIMSTWNLNLTTWLASAGVAGIAIGFAAKDTLANFISGIFILADAPYKVGDYIIIDGTTRGMVTDIGMRSTRVLTRDNVQVTVPNAVIGNAKIVNETSGPSPQMRVHVEVGVAYGSDVDLVKEVLLRCTAGVPHVSTAAAPSVRFTAMGDSALAFQVRVYVDQPEFRGLVVDALNTLIYKALAEHGIQIPYPQRDLHIKSWPGPPGE